jgi:hypothetical protein
MARYISALTAKPDGVLLIAVEVAPGAAQLPNGGIRGSGCRRSEKQWRAGALEGCRRKRRKAFFGPAKKVPSLVADWLRIEERGKARAKAIEERAKFRPRQWSRDGNALFGQALCMAMGSDLDGLLPKWGKNWHDEVKLLPDKDKKRIFEILIEASTGPTVAVLKLLSLTLRH